MPLDESYIDLNHASTERIRAIAAGHTDADLQRPVGEHWTVAIALTHLAFRDRKVLQLLDATERNGAPVIAGIDVLVNDLPLPLWAAIPPREAARLAIETSDALDRCLEIFAPALLKLVFGGNERWVVRAQHRNEHLYACDAALAGQPD